MTHSLLNPESLHVERVASTGSTNADLLEREELVHGTVRIAATQTAARGRLGRPWVSPPEAQLCLSVGLVPQSLDAVGLLPLALGVAVVDTVPQAELKWPNDVLIGGKKLCGILCEAAADEASPAGMRVVAGLGVNTLLERSQLPVPHATSLALEGLEADIEAELMSNICARLNQWQRGDAQLMEDYRRRCVSIGKQVRLQAPGGDVVGTVDGVADDGRISVDGQLFFAGDITHLRPASQEADNFYG